MSNDSFRISSPHTIQIYPIGLSVGDRLKLIKKIIIRDSDGNPTGKLHMPGEIWTVMPGCIDDLTIIWLKQPDGLDHTWDHETIFDTFERLTADQSKTEQGAAANP